MSDTKFQIDKSWLGKPCLKEAVAERRAILIMQGRCLLPEVISVWKKGTSTNSEKLITDSQTQIDEVEDDESLSTKKIVAIK